MSMIVSTAKLGTIATRLPLASVTKSSAEGKSASLPLTILFCQRRGAIPLGAS